MSEKLKHTLYTPTDCISEQTMFDYIDNKLSPKEQHVVEKHLLECELCADAMDGLRLVKNRSITGTINQLVSEKMALPLPVKKSGGFNYKIIMSIAAGLLLLMGGVFFFNHLSPSAEEKATVADLPAKQKEVQTNEEVPPPVDSQTTPPSGTVTTKSTTNAATGTYDQLPLAESKAEEVQQQKPSQETTPDELKDEFKKVNDAEIAEKTIVMDRAAKSATGASVKWADSLSVAANNGTAGVTYEWNTAADKDDNAAGAGLAAPQKEETKNQTTTYAVVTEDEQSHDEAKGKKATENRKENAAAGDVKAAPSTTSATPAYAPPDIAQNTDHTIMADSVSTLETANKITASKTQAVDQFPEFPGGNAAMVKFLNANAKWPVLEADKGITSTKIFVQFTIDKNGNVKNPKILKGINAAYDKEALRLVSSMPKWKPATSHGKSIEYLYNLPIRIEFK